MTHRVTALQFIRGTNDGPADCSCGWSGLASEFSAHRKASGATPPASGSVGPRTTTPDEWNGHLRTHCRHGHRLTPDNLYNAPRSTYGGKKSYTVCLTCRRDAAERLNEKRRVGARVTA